MLRTARNKVRRRFVNARSTNTSGEKAYVVQQQTYRSHDDQPHVLMKDCRHSEILDTDVRVYAECRRGNQLQLQDQAKSICQRDAISELQLSLEPDCNT